MPLQLELPLDYIKLNFKYVGSQDIKRSLFRSIKILI
jgi:hypothetical protein